MGGKRLSKGNSIYFHLAIWIGVMVFISGCNGVRSRPFPKDQEYVADFQYLEKVMGFIDRGKFKAALTENAKLEKYLDDSVNRSSDYDRVIRVSARMNSSLLKKVIQDKKTLSMLSQKVQEKDLVIKTLNSEIKNQKSEMNKLTWKLQSITLLLKAVERLDTETKMLRQQIKDFKEIDLEGGKINADMQK